MRANSILDEVDELFDHSDLLLLRILDLHAGKPLRIELVYELDKEATVNCVDQVEEPLTTVHICCFVLLLIKPRKVAHNCLVLLYHLVDRIHAELLKLRHVHPVDLVVVEELLMSAKDIFDMVQRTPASLRHVDLAYGRRLADQSLTSIHE